jgi:methionine-rich copper-binding protein CopC
MTSRISGRRIRNRAVVALAIAIALCGVAERAAAHALLVESIPAVAATLEAAPPQLVLRFNSRIEHKLSRATLSLDDGGEPRALAVDAGAAPDRFVATLPPLAPGSYVVDWQVLSVDGHRVAGKLRFQIRGPG